MLITPSTVLAQVCSPGAHPDESPDPPPGAPLQGPLAAPLVPSPHPLITEILFAVPTEDGDANRDGRRHVSGDEFVELINPHDEPIDLTGYTLRDSADGSRRFAFTFPELTLGPGQCAVVFNGNETKWHGPVGDDERAPIAAHPWFPGTKGDAHVFTARAGGAVSFANSGDFILLGDPSGRPVQCVVWGEPASPVPPASPHASFLIEETDRVTQTSVQRRAFGGLPVGPLVRHDELDGRAFSPGEGFVVQADAEGADVAQPLIGPPRPSENQAK